MIGLLRARRAAICALALAGLGLLAGCGGLAPAQTVVPSPSASRPPAQASATALAVTASAQPPTPGPSPTVNAPATSRAVILTITALAATPTYPPTSTSSPTRVVVGAGPGDAVPTAQTPIIGVVVKPLAFQVTRGGVAAMTVRAQPGALCTLFREAEGGRREPVRGVNPGQTAGDGVLAWIWTVAEDLPPGALDLLVDCGAAGAARTRIDILR